MVQKSRLEVYQGEQYFKCDHTGIVLEEAYIIPQKGNLVGIGFFADPVVAIDWVTSNEDFKQGRKDRLLKDIAQDLKIKQITSLPICPPEDIKPTGCTFAYRNEKFYKEKILPQADFTTVSEYLILLEAQQKKEENEGVVSRPKKQYLYTVKPEHTQFGESVVEQDEDDEFEFQKENPFKYTGNVKINGKNCTVLHWKNEIDPTNHVMNDVTGFKDYTGLVYVISASKLHKEPKKRKALPSEEETSDGSEKKKKSRRGEEPSKEEDETQPSV